MPILNYCQASNNQKAELSSVLLRAIWSLLLAMKNNLSPNHPFLSLSLSVCLQGVCAGEPRTRTPHLSGKGKKSATAPGPPSGQLSYDGRQTVRSLDPAQSKYLKPLRLILSHEGQCHWKAEEEKQERATSTTQPAIFCCAVGRERLFLGSASG